MMESTGGVFVFLFVLSFLCSLLLYNEGRTQARQPLEAYLRCEVGNTGSNTWISKALFKELNNDSDEASSARTRGRVLGTWWPLAGAWLIEVIGLAWSQTARRDRMLLPARLAQLHGLLWTPPGTCSYCGGDSVGGHALVSIYIWRKQWWETWWFQDTWEWLCCPVWKAQPAEDHRPWQSTEGLEERWGEPDVEYWVPTSVFPRTVWEQKRPCWS